VIETIATDSIRNFLSLAVDHPPMPSLAVAVALFVVALAALVWSSDRFVSAVEEVGFAVGISPFIIGATVVAAGTSLPELVSSVLAVVRGAPAIVVGNVVGSNVANVLFIIGLAAAVGGHLRIDRELMRVDLPLLTASATFLVVTVWTDAFRWYEGLLALVGVGTYVHFTMSERTRLDEVVGELVEEHVEEPVERIEELEMDVVAREKTVGLRTYVTIAVTLAVIFVTADQLVRSILTIADALDIGAELVAITAVAVGTSLPEVAVSLAAVRRGDVEIAVGNVLGSNVFNTFGVMGIASLFGPLTVPGTIRGYALPVMVLATVLYYFIVQDRELTRWEGVTLLVLYLAFLFNLGQFVG